ncbi:unnamed protein product [Ectocarpus sp. 8 AP-2014]
MVESAADNLCSIAATKDVSFLVVGDPFRCSTVTHSDLFNRARERGLEVEVIQNVSSVAAIGSCGLKGDKFGQVASLTTRDEKYKPGDFHAVIRANTANGMHTPCSLYIDVGGGYPDFPAQYMTVGMALRHLLEVARSKGGGAYGSDTQCVGVARPGRPTQTVVAGRISELLDVDFGEPPHNLVICGATDSEEDQALEWHRVAAGPIKRSPAVADPPLKEPVQQQPCLLKCPALHGLTAFTVPHNSIQCDVCFTLMTQGSRAHGCRRCDHDVCDDCSTGRATDRRAAENAAGRARMFSDAEAASKIRMARVEMELVQLQMQNASRMTAAMINLSSCNCTCSCSKCSK